MSAIAYPLPGVHLWLTDTRRHAPRLLTLTGSLENDPAVSPDGTRLALTLQQADYDLYRLSVEHPAPSGLLATSRNEMDPAWSPRGDQMAYTTDRAGHEEIWLRSQNGAFERPLVTPQDFGASQTYALGSAAFAPDGERIAYLRLSAEGYRVWITPVGGGPPVQLAPGENYQDSPSWSPDGVWIAYVQVPNLYPNWSLAKMRVGARTAPNVLARDIVPFSRVHWSPDGAWIAYDGRAGLSLVSPDGKSTRVLQEQQWPGFTWSADGRRLYGIRPSDDGKHLTFASVVIASGTEEVLADNFMPLPFAGLPVRGFTRASPTSFVTSIAHVRSDIWLLDGFQPLPTLWDRLTSAIPFRNR